MNPRLLVAMVDGIRTGVTSIFPGVVDPHGVIYYVDGTDYMRNNRSTVNCGGSRFVRKMSGINRSVDTTNLLDDRFDDYEYYGAEAV